MLPASTTSSENARKSPMEIGDELIEKSMSQMKEALKQDEQMRLEGLSNDTNYIAERCPRSDLSSKNENDLEKTGSIPPSALSPSHNIKVVELSHMPASL